LRASSCATPSSRAAGVRDAAERTLSLAVRAPNWLGDAVLALPALRDIRQATPRSTKLAVVARPSVAPLYEAVPEVDEVAVVSGVLDEARVLRSGRYKRVILMPNSFSVAFAGWLAGVPEREGYCTQGRSALLTRGVPLSTEVRGKTQVVYYRAMVAGLGMDTSRAPDGALRCPPAWLEGANSLLSEARERALIGIAPGAAKGGAKQWPPARFSAAAELLARQFDAVVVLLGSGADRAACAAVGGRLRNVAAIDLSGRTSLRDLVGVVARLRGLVANDSGAMHLGAALGVPTVGVFGPTNPAETGPQGARAALVRGVAECSPCRHVECPIDHRCMTSIAPDQVAESLRRVIGAP
jgi:heptosyltransferase-2